MNSNIRCLFVLLCFSAGCMSQSKMHTSSRSAPAVGEKRQTDEEPPNPATLPPDPCEKEKASSKDSTGDIVILGTVSKIYISPLRESELNWVVQCSVDKVVSGSLPHKTFSFRIHSPSKSGLEAGKQYTINIEETANGYTVDQYQWSRGPGCSNPR